MQKTIRIVALALSLVMVFGIAACGGGDTGTSSAPGGSSAPPAGSASPSTAPGGSSSAPPSGSASGGASGEPIKIVLTATMTGAGSMYGESFLGGCLLAVHEINEAGGVNGRPLELVLEDTLSTNEGALMAYHKIKDEGYPYFIQGPGSAATLGLIGLAQEDGIVVLGGQATNPRLREYTGTYLCMMESDDRQGIGLSLLARQAGAKEIAAILTDTDAMHGVYDNFARDFEAHGGKILAKEVVQPETVDCRTELTKIKQQNPDFMLCLSNIEIGGIMIKQAMELGMDVQWITHNSNQSQEFVDAGGSATEGVIVISPGQTSGNPEYEKFSQAHRDVIGRDPGIYSQYFYEAVKIIADSIEKYGYTADGLVRYYMEVENRVTPWGLLTTDAGGYGIGVWSSFQVKNGEFVFTGPVEMD